VVQKEKRKKRRANSGVVGHCAPQRKGGRGRPRGTLAVAQELAVSVKGGEGKARHLSSFLPAGTEKRGETCLADLKTKKGTPYSAGERHMEKAGEKKIRMLSLFRAEMEEREGEPTASFL